MIGSIEVTSLSKAYKQYPTRWSRLTEWLLPGKRPRHHQHWVLQDINFKVENGEAVGIVGINGAGKSTLLKMIVGTSQCTTGSVKVIGRVAALLELGMGFHPDFTGRQNSFMASQLLGNSIQEITQLMPEIEAFAEIGDYIDQPVRVYSSGMLLRLAFSVATAKRPDILIVDEALSVGDKYFSQKSFARIQSFLDKGTTLLFVSHDATAIKALCNRAILLDKGRVALIADPESVIDRYNGMLLEKANQLLELKTQPTKLDTSTTVNEDPDYKPRQIEGFREIHAQIDTGEIKLVDFRILDAADRRVAAVTTGDEIFIRCKIKALVDMDELYFGFALRDRLGITVYNTTSYAIGHHGIRLNANDSKTIQWALKVPIQVGFYGVCVGFVSGYAGFGSYDKYILHVINAEILEIIGDGSVGTFGGVVNLFPRFLEL